MEIILYMFMTLLGYIGVSYELKYKKVDILFFIFILLFIIIATERINSNIELGDLYYYLERFKDDEDSYFEPGYVFVTNCIKLLFGHNPYALVIVVCVWVISFTYLASKICQKYMPDSSNTFFSSRKSSYVLCLFFFVCPYWGCFFSWMTLRVGLATTILYCANSYAINNRMFFSIVIALISILFHTSSVVYVLGIIILFFIKCLSKRSYIIWFVLIIILRLLSFFTISVGGVVESIVLSNELFSHYVNYLDPEVDTSVIFSPQDIAYHAFGLLMLKGNLSEIRYNRAVMIYYLGLSAGAVFFGNGITMRLQWFFLSMVIFPLYYFVIDRHFSLKTKQVIIMGYTIIEQVMTIRQFGWYF